MSKMVFFDGVCNMCNGLVNFVLRHDHKQQYQFASLQGATAARVLPEHWRASLATIVVKDGEKIFTESDAIMHLLRDLGGFWQILSWLRFLPKGLRDWGYRLVAKNRYRWFGKKEFCRLPTASERGRLLE
jgi:predicted DCC family thiol-disulfide oxidoreductase YuxK